ncbi:site-specific integrase [Sulfurimonas sp.]|jgi:integrase|uniref:tyrosine-type recombinase/integrase n=1 Tax=Sulfurimonas sp. TaxID=2022749 RepID=UPI002A36368A|nr:site-specific integrase [Sulfurimonas sp.]MDY0123923.1 site-specific integrase [Sulfurimonas sp.]
MSDLIKTKFAGIYYKEDAQTKVKTYIARIKIAGVIDTQQIVGYSNDSIRTNPSIAFQKRNELIQKIKAGDSIRAEDNPTLDSYFKEYMDFKESGNLLSTKKITVYKSFYHTHIPHSLKIKKLKQITKEDFQKVINTMVKNGNKPSFIETVKTCFSPIFNDAIEKSIIDKNVIKGLKFPDYDPNKYFNLPDDKVKALFEAIMNIANNQYRLMFMFLLRGRRAGEVLSMQWSDINFENKTYSIRDSQSKIRKNLTFSIDDELLAHFEYLDKKESGFIFINPKTNRPYFTFPVRVWNRIRKDVGIEEMTIHDFRHLLGFTLVNNNVPLEHISKALGHSKITTTQRYSNQKELMAKQAVDVFLGIVKK